MTLCLNMIVKNESEIIEGTLSLLTKQIKFDYYVICDTGSSDNTINIIDSFFKKKGVPGEIHVDEWKDFGHNRSLALNYAKNKCDYTFIFDADDYIVGTVNLNKLEKDSYLLKFGSHNLCYQRKCIVKSSLPWKYAGVLHECIKCEINHSQEILQGDYYVVSGRTSSRNKNPNKYLDDAKILERGFVESLENNDGLHSRYAYYCANSYYDAGKKAESIKWYKKTLDLDGWTDEKYNSCLKLSQLVSEESRYYYLVKSHTYNQQRVEGILELVKYHIQQKNYNLSVVYYSLVKKYYENEYLRDDISRHLFTQSMDYTFYLAYFMIIALSYTGDFDSGLKMYLIIFEKKSFPGNLWINNLFWNLKFYLQHSNELFVNKLNEWITFIEKNNNYTFDNNLIEEYSKYGVQQKQSVLIYTGFMSFLWNDTYIANNPMGGSEKAVCYLARNFPKNYQIVVSGDVKTETIDNIKYINKSELNPKQKFHTVIVSRYLSFFELFPEIVYTKLFIMAHDVKLFNYGSTKTELELLSSYKFDKVVCLTKWHKELFENKYNLQNKIEIINNGINVDNFSQTRKIKNKFIYSSCSERGLERLLELWPSILENLPDATLDICSYNDFPVNELENKMQKVINFHESITHHGKLKESDLYQLIGKSEYWLYPTNFYETSCITSIEMLMSEVICLYYPIGALNDTLGNYGIPVKHGNEIETILNLSEYTKQQFRKKGKEYATNCSWKNRANEWLKLINQTQDIWVFYHDLYHTTSIKQYIQNLNGVNGFKVHLTNDKNLIKQLKPKKITIILNNWKEIGKYDCIIDESLFGEFSFADFSYLQLEPLNLKHRLECVKTIKRKLKIYDYSLSNIRILKENGITDCEHLPYIVTDSEKQLLSRLNKETPKEYDFGFINHKKEMPITPPRRNKVLKHLINNGFRINIIPGWGEDRDRELAKCKIILNIHGQINENPEPSADECSNIFENIRCDRLLASGFKILSEECVYLETTHPNLEIIKYTDFFNKFVGKRKIVDCFIFYNEVDMLDYRLNLLKGVVDYFIIVESKFTFAGKPKEMYFDTEKYRDYKIIYIVLEEIPHQNPDNKQIWSNEIFQRNCIERGIHKIPLNENDLLIISDLDEIPDPETIKLIKTDNVVQLEQDFYYYNLETKINHNWYFSKVVNYGWFKNSKTTFQKIRMSNCEIIKKGGWHLSYFGTPEFIQNKIQNFSHQEFNKPEYTDISEISKRMNSGMDIYNRTQVPFNKIEVSQNEYLPPGYLFLKK